MRFLLKISAGIDWVNAQFGKLANLLVLLAVIVSAANAMSRYAFSVSSNAFLEIQWYMLAALVMLGASYVLQRNEHVRVEIFYVYLSERGRLWLDLLGTILFLIPSCLLVAVLAWPFFMASYEVGEWSSNAGGLVRWPIKFVLPFGFLVVALQGISEVIKRIAALRGWRRLDATYERPIQ
jgi:TRAP-type mannitol/chloroaromatic compound transport system permease small subunit